MNGILKKLGVAAIMLMIFIPLTFAQTAVPPIIPVQDGDAATKDETLIIPHATEGATAGAYFQSVYLPEITRVVIAIAGAAAFLFVIIGGIQILTAYGDEEKITGAKKTIEYAIVGLIIAILSYSIVSIIGGVQVSQVTQPDQGSEEWQEANKGLDQEGQDEKAGLQEKYADVPGSEDMSLEELKGLE